MLADAKLNTLFTHISKAISDNKVEHSEFTLIMDELEKYKVMKEEIRVKEKKQVRGTRKFNREGETGSTGGISQTSRKKQWNPLRLKLKPPKFKCSCACEIGNTN